MEKFPTDKFHNYSLILVWSPCYMSVIEVEPMVSISIHRKHIDLISLTVCSSRLSTISFEIPDSSTLLNQLYCSDRAFIISNLATFSVSPLSTFFEIITLLFSPSIVWKVSKCQVFSGPYFPVFELNTEKYAPEKCPYLDTSCSDRFLSSLSIAFTCCANQLTGFYMRAALALNGLTEMLDYPSTYNWGGLKNLLSIFLFKKQSPEVLSKKRCSQKFHKIQTKTPVPESLFNKAAVFRPQATGQLLLLFLIYPFICLNVSVYVLWFTNDLPWRYNTV